MSKTMFLQHSDEVSGTTILEDGTKAYWTEGRSSRVVIVRPDGSKEKIPVWIKHPILDKLTQAEQDRNTIFRQMTKQEEEEWKHAREI